MLASGQLKVFSFFFVKGRWLKVMSQYKANKKDVIEKK